MAAGAQVSLTIPDLPAGTTSVVLNVTATNPTATGYLTEYPTGAVRPATTSVSFAKGRTVPDLVVVNVGPGGKVTFYNSAVRSPSSPTWLGTTGPEALLLSA